jgi:hypothetical protein
LDSACGCGARAGKGEWYRHNDSEVTAIRAADATEGDRQRDCYMVFYVAAQ